jgi:uncharacterized cupin superfamily protein
MPRGSKVFKPPEVPESNASNYPAPFREAQRKRFVRRLSNHAGLKNYGVNYVRVAPGGQSSARHAHKKQDEFVYVVEGEFVLVTDAGRETVGPGPASAFRPGRVTATTSSTSPIGMRRSSWSGTGPQVRK